MVVAMFQIQDGGCRARVTGHATGDPGMCAAVSGILYSLAGYLVNAESAGRADKKASSLESGDAELEYTGGDNVKAVFQMAYIGLKQLERAEPSLVQAFCNPDKIIF